jgi:hypothetical protein
MIGTKNSKVDVYFRKDAFPDEMEDIRCIRCQRHYL